MDSWSDEKRWFYLFCWFVGKIVSTTVTTLLPHGVNNNKLQVRIAVVLKWDSVCVQLQIIVFNGFTHDHNHHLKYLGATLKRTLSFKNHLKNTTAKLSNENVVIQKLYNTSWGRFCLYTIGYRFSLYPVAEFCARVKLYDVTTRQRRTPTIITSLNQNLAR